MPLSTKTQDEIFNAMKADLASRVPLLDLDRPGVARALLQVFAAALRMLHVAVEEIYDNLFPDTADRVTLSRWYEVFGLTWNNDTSTEDARRQVLFLFRDAVPGSAAFYEQYILTHFEEVDRVEVRPRLRGAGTVDIVVSKGGRPVPRDVVDKIQTALNADPAARVVGVDVRVKTEDTGVHLPV